MCNFYDSVKIQCDLLNTFMWNYIYINPVMSIEMIWNHLYNWFVYINQYWNLIPNLLKKKNYRNLHKYNLLFQLTKSMQKKKQNILINYIQNNIALFIFGLNRDDS